MFRGQFFDASVRGDRNLAVASQFRGAHDRGDFVLFEQGLNAAFHLFGNTTRALHHSFEVEVSLLNRQTEFFGAVHQVEHLSRAQHCLGRDTAPVEANAAQMLALNASHIQTELRAADCSNIATRTSADNDHVKVLGGHSFLLRFQISLTLN